MPVEKDLHEAEQDIAQFQQFYAGDELPMDFYLEDEHELPKRGRIAPPIYDYSLKYLPSTKVGSLLIPLTPLNPPSGNFKKEREGGR